MRDEQFVPNDTQIDSEDAAIILLTGPNMAGKSVYIKQVALIVLMAQMGSFVPAEEARIGLVDRIFTRVGAQDDIATGRSTFMVEMEETANILNHATPLAGHPGRDRARHLHLRRPGDCAGGGGVHTQAPGLGARRSSPRITTS